MNADARRFFRDRQNWRYGPLLIVSCKFSRAQTITARQLSCLPLIPLNNIRQFDTIQIPLQLPWMKDLYLWPLERDNWVGVRFLPRPETGKIELCIPPRHLKRVFGEFPWFRRYSDSLERSLLTDQAVFAHRVLLASLAQLHEHTPIQHLVIVDEAYRSKVMPEEGIWVQCAFASGLHGKPPRAECDFLCQLDAEFSEFLDVCG